MNDERVTMEEPSETTLKAKIEIKAAPEKVYAAWTKPERFSQWFGPPKGGGSLEVARFEPAIGGGYDVTMVFPDGDRVRLFGEYLELDPFDRIVFTWQWAEGTDTSNETRVTVDLAPSPLGTQLTLTHERFLNSADRDQHESGWDPLLVRLADTIVND